MRGLARIAALLLLAGTLGAIVGCPGRSSGPRETLVIRGGPLLRDVFPKVVAEFETRYPEVRLRSDFSCPPCVLTSRMDEGLEMDVFISAGNVERDLLAEGGLLDASTTRTIGAANLVLAVPPDNPANVRALGDLHRAQVKHIAVGDPERTSPGRYTRQALERMGLWGEVQGKLAISKTGCEALKSVMLGQAEAALLYDFCLHGRADEPHLVQRVPEELHDPITLGITAAPGRSGPAVQAFFEFMESPVAQAALRRAGIGPPPGSEENG